MKLNAKRVLVHIDGKTPIKTEVAQGVTETLTAGSAILGAVLATEQDETPAAKVQAYQLAQRIAASLNSKEDDDSVDLSAEEVVLAKAKAGRLYGPLVYGQLAELLV